MTTINALLEAFDKLQLGKFEKDLHIPCTKEDYHDFIRQFFTKYNSELAAKVEGMKVRLRDKHRNDGWADHELPDVAHNATLDDVLALLKEGRYDGRNT